MYYNVLNVKPSTATDDIRKEYLKLVLQHHPDKQSANSNNDASNSEFQKIVLAWETLSDPVKRAQYDANLQEQSRQRAAIHEQVRADDMTFDAESGIYSYACRCGGSYQVYEEDLADGPVEAPCSNCSLHIEVFLQ
ncbi:hypothetical protein SmJEL517_g02293 [Synchytrium microbalum]|uniref:Diphthamide biosynthesis protein 4 n=1 Tax=Synchytrium microbalum TaxID=1806994 RepID=A0A507CBF4_9FUNG|nr:uncharacterized protein SmJEL517_g02293 [Synchytrium microbalum]TPX35284.1 hypothetical protein SmJEL517_g02293 [Synchytrium microbalum]